MEKSPKAISDGVYYLVHLQAVKFYAFSSHLREQIVYSEICKTEMNFRAHVDGQYSTPSLIIILYIQWHIKCCQRRSCPKHDKKKQSIGIKSFHSNSSYGSEYKKTVSINCLLKC